ncbi:F-box only protein 8-like [Oppia nitens]|uniref:F-box only protein 8-like n=1 Tax=Oppia nitens TaxID=1686743 RepID=UPI0023DB0FB9|nr:F-box only protein 8-like [Oppia nitens]
MLSIGWPPLLTETMGQILRLMAQQLLYGDYNYVNYNSNYNHRMNDIIDNCNDNNDDNYSSDDNRRKRRQDDSETNAIPDLSEWPPELSLTVLKNLNATDLCLAACVWTELATDEVLWHSLSCSQWGYASIYFKPKADNFSYRRLYLQLDEGSITFNADSQTGIEYFNRHGLVDNNTAEIAQFIHAAKPLDKRQVRLFLNSRPDILDYLVNLENFENQFLPIALRRFFTVLQAPNKRDHYLHLLVDKFSHRFSQCNPELGLSADTIYVLCFSLIMLSVDLSSPHIKNKMSKREFIRNVRNAIHRVDDELYGHLYDDIYLKGHIAINANN